LEKLKGEFSVSKRTKRADFFQFKKTRIFVSELHCRCYHKGDHPFDRRTGAGSRWIKNNQEILIRGKGVCRKRVTIIALYIQSIAIFLYYHLIVTDNCNLCCSYCRAKAFDERTDDDSVRIEVDSDLPVEPEYDLEELYAFLARDPCPVLTFYGGEPLLRDDLIRRIMDEAPVKRFMVQTNGLLLDQLEPAYVNRFTTILVSLDGSEVLTDKHRGAGTHRRVMENLKGILKRGFAGELIARMTVAEDSDIFHAVTSLADNPDHPFTSIHWQLDANFSSDFACRSFASWVQESYNPGIHSLVHHWVRLMETTGRVPRWYPFVDTMDDLLRGNESLLRCGAGHANYSIMTDGHIAPCPVMVGIRSHYVGHIRHTPPQELERIPVEGDCLSCPIRSFCGGRCLYANIVQPWNAEERRLVCGTIKNLHTALTAAVPDVLSLLSSGRIDLQAFSCEKYNGCEIIP
jgi:putative peptide-modifying radical SAM enzyme